ncbi:MAG: pyruvate ferredoxin oxidoreductase [Bacillota bacterium]
MPVEMITGNQAAALAAQRAGVDLVAAYPITPQTAIVEYLAEFWARGELGGEFVSVESEYAALACSSGAAALGARTFSATSSHGLAYMHEMLHWCAGARYPMVLVNVNRALGAPWCLEPDQGDSLSQRDTGWLQLYCANAQEIFDTILQAFALAETIMIPCMVVFDGFYLSHTYEAVEVPDQETVRRFLQPPSFDPPLVPGRHANLHALTTGEVQTGLIRERHRVMQGAAAVLAEIDTRFQAVFQRGYGALAAEIPAGAKTVVLAAGSCAETVRWHLPHLAGTGLINLRMFRPFPGDILCRMLEEKAVERVVVVDRNCSPGVGGILAQELKAALYRMAQPPVVHDLLLAGGIDFTPRMLTEALAEKRASARSAEIWGVELS